MLEKLYGRREESGQALVLIAFLMIAILGFTALAIDGGRLFWIHRDAQNAADSAGKDAAIAICGELSDTEIEQAAMYAAGLDGFTTESGDTITVTHPVPDIPDTNERRRVEVTITRQVDASMAIEGMIPSSSPAGASSVHSCVVNPLVQTGSGVVGLCNPNEDSDCPCTVKITGSSINVSGVWSNGDICSSSADGNFGTCNHVGEANLSQQTTCGQQQQVDPIDEEFLPQPLTQEQRHQICLTAGADCNEISGDVHVTPSSCPETFEGVWNIIDGGGFQANCSFTCGERGVTFLVDGDIDLKTNLVLDCKPFEGQDYLFYTENNLQISASESRLSGVNSARNGECKVSTSGNTSTGGLWLCYFVDWAASATNVFLDEDYDGIQSRWAERNR